MSLTRRDWLATIARTARNFRDDGALDLAAMVAFYTLLAIGPLLYLIGTGLVQFAHDPDALGLAVRRLSVFLPASAAPLLNEVAADLPDFEEGGVLFAIPGLISVTTSALSSLEYAMNVAFGTAPQRRFWHSRLKALTVLAAGFGLLGLSVVLTTLPDLLEQARIQAGLPPPPSRLADRLPYFALLGLSFAAFTLIYKALPRGRVGWKAAGAGAALALILWEAARSLFSALLGRSPSFGLLTGAVAGVAAFLIWIYTAVAVVLLGAEFAAVLNGNRGNDRPVDAAPGTHRAP